MYSADPDEMPPYVAFHLGFTVYLSTCLLLFRMERVKELFMFMKLYEGLNLNAIIHKYPKGHFLCLMANIYVSTKLTKLFPVEFYVPVINHLQKKSLFFARFSFMM